MSTTKPAQGGARESRKASRAGASMGVATGPDRAYPSGEVVGRDKELTAIAGFLDAAETGPAALLLEGPAGIGKTTLWKAGMAEASARSYRLLASRPASAEARLSFTALGDLLTGVVDEVLRGLPEPQRHALEVALLLEETPAPPPDQRAVALAFLNAVRVLAVKQPMLLAVDDVQWLDTPSEAVLEFAARRLAEEPVRFLMTRRSDGAHRAPLDLDRALPADRLRRVDIGPLSIGALHRILQTRLDTPLPRPTLRRVHELSGGNPFFALEIARALDRRGLNVRPGEDVPLPQDLDELVRERLAALPGGVQDLVRVAAALSAPTVALVDAALGADCMRTLAIAVDAHVVELHGDVILFTHPLLAHGAYSVMAPAERRSLHRGLAEVVTDPEESARHLALAAEGPDASLARIVAEAARRAARRGAPQTAAELAERARDLSPAEELEYRRDRAFEAAGYRVEAGHTSEARALLEEALALTPPGPARAQEVVEVARIAMIQTDPRLAHDLARQALAAAGEHGPVRVRAEEFLAVLLCNLQQNLPEAAAHAQAAAELAAAAGDDAAASSALGTQGWAESLLGRPAAEATLRQALALVRPGSIRWVINDPRFSFALFCALRDDFAGARRALVAVQNDAAERGEEAAVSLLLVQLSVLAWLEGDLAEAACCADKAGEAAISAGQSSNEAAALGARALVEAQLGRIAGAQAAAAEALDLWQGVAVWLATAADALNARALLALSLGDPESAHSHLTELVELARNAGIGEPGAMRFVPDEVEALLALGHTSEAEELLDWFEQHARRLDRASALARCHRCRGVHAAAAGDFKAAFSFFEQALVEHDRGRIPLEQARTLLALGAAQRRAKQKRSARETLERGVALFEELGASLWADRAREELGRIAGRGPASCRLTPTEERVAGLVADGRTNKEAAAALFVTVRTVEAHLTKIYDKLGVRSRAELARRFR